MIALFAAILAGAAAASGSPCPDLVTPPALVCRALQSEKSGDSQAAALGFEQAALASPEKESSTARMFAAAGNMWIAAGQPEKAAIDLDKALAIPVLSGAQRGEALLDRARAAEAVGDLATARAKLNLAATTISPDPFYWYFSAALAVREGDGATAQAAIAKALELAPGDPTILFEAGHVADFAGDDDKARTYWQQAASADPNGPTGRAAAKAMELLGVTPTVTMDPAQPK